MKIKAVHHGSDQGIETAVNAAITELEESDNRVLDIKYVITTSGNGGDTSSMIIAFIHYEAAVVRTAAAAA